MQSIEDKKLKKDHQHVVDKVRKLLVECEEKDIRLDLVLHTAFTVMFDTALDTAPDKRTLFGLMATSMAAAYEANMEYIKDEDVLDESKPSDKDFIH